MGSAKCLAAEDDFSQFLIDTGQQEVRVYRKTVCFCSLTQFISRGKDSVCWSMSVFAICCTEGDGLLQACDSVSDSTIESINQIEFHTVWNTSERDSHIGFSLY